MNLTDLPGLIVNKIATYLADETPFRDKSDVVTDCCSLAVAGARHLHQELLMIIDPCTKDRKLSLLVHQNIIIEKNRWILSKTAIETWGVSDEDLHSIPKRMIVLKSKSVNMYRLRDVRRASEAKFEGSYEKLKAFNNSQQLERVNRLKKILTQYNISIRLDSKCCDNYIKYNKGDPTNIARLLKEMEFYHIFTNYNKLFNMFAAKYQSEYGYYDRDHVSSDAKKKALKDFVKLQPDRVHMIPSSLHKFISNVI